MLTQSFGAIWCHLATLSQLLDALHTCPNTQRARTLISIRMSSYNVKIWWSYDYLISTMWFPILVRWHLYIWNRAEKSWITSSIFKNAVWSANTYRARLFSKSSLARLQEFWNSSICLYEIKKKNLSKSTCLTGSFTCLGPSGSGKRRALT